MNIKKFKKTLSNLVAIADSIQVNDQISALEQELIKKQLVSLYEYLLDSKDLNSKSDSNKKTPKEQVKQAYDEIFSAPDPNPVEPEPVLHVQETPVPIDTEPEDTVVEPEPVQVEQAIHHQMEEVVPSSPQEQGAAPVSTIQHDAGILNEEHEDILDVDNNQNELSDRLSEQPISDLTKAMGINERMLTINELFDGNNQAFKEALSALNSLNSFEEAKSYISVHLIEQYSWIHPKKRKKAKVFIKLVKRRFN